MRAERLGLASEANWGYPPSMFLKIDLFLILCVMFHFDLKILHLFTLGPFSDLEVRFSFYSYHHLLNRVNFRFSHPTEAKN